MSGPSIDNIAGVLVAVTLLIVSVVTGIAGSSTFSVVVSVLAMIVVLLTDVGRNIVRATFGAPHDRLHDDEGPGGGR